MASDVRPLEQKDTENPVHCCVCLNLLSGSPARTPATHQVDNYCLCDEHTEWIQSRGGRPSEYPGLIRQALHHHTIKKGQNV